ncbi:MULTISPECIES: hypothetical protein [unclassified Kitasatospora]|uniref:hypothetical protein n=1 Tax=unclassified Kitasatospora TaxID=2633591 RepID=UPI0033C0E9CF
MTRAAPGPHPHPLIPADLSPGTAWWSSCPDCRTPTQGGLLGLTAHRPDPGDRRIPITNRLDR